VASETLHESPDKLDPKTVDRHRAIASVMEELEAVDWYDQRVDATEDAALKAILAHNRDEEKEHASMVLEWLRRNDAKVDQFFREYLFTEGSIAGREAELEGKAPSGAGSEEREGAPRSGAAPRPAAAGSLGIGSLKGQVGR
jgi:ferritin-like protein